MSGTPDAPGPRQGRPRITTRSRIQQAALLLFEARGFNETTVEDIASAAGIGRRTFFRYFASKQDLATWSLDAFLKGMQEALSRSHTDPSITHALRTALLEGARAVDDDDTLSNSRRQFTLMPASMQAASFGMLSIPWRTCTVNFLSIRTGLDPDDLKLLTFAWIHYSIAMAALERWLTGDEMSLRRMVELALRSIDER